MIKIYSYGEVPLEDILARREEGLEDHARSALSRTEKEEKQ